MSSSFPNFCICNFCCKRNIQDLGRNTFFYAVLEFVTRTRVAGVAGTVQLIHLGKFEPIKVTFDCSRVEVGHYHWNCGRIFVVYKEVWVVDEYLVFGQILDSEECTSGLSNHLVQS